MKKWHGTISVKSNYKAQYFYITVEADTVLEGIKKARDEFIKKRLKPVVILGIKLQEIEE